MKGAIQIKNKTRLKAIQLARSQLLAEIEQAELAIELAYLLTWPKSVWHKRDANKAIAYMRDQIRQLDRKSFVIEAMPRTLRVQAA